MNLKWKKIRPYLPTFLIICPVLLGVSRNLILNWTTENLHVYKVKAEAISPVNCTGDICNQATSFILPNTESPFERPAVGYYGAQLDSYVRLDGTDIDPILASKDIRYTWSSFKLVNLPKRNVRVDKVVVVSVSPAGTKKIGMDPGYTFYGETKNIEVLQFLYSLFNIHLYLFGALTVLAVGIATSLSTPQEDRAPIEDNVSKIFFFFFGLLAFSSAFNDLLLALNLSPSVVTSLPRLFWAPCLLLIIFESKQIKISLAAVWIILVAVGFGQGQAGDLVKFICYRWMVLSVMLLAGQRVFARKDLRYLQAYVLLAFLDSLSLFGVFPVLSGVYLSPLGLSGLFVASRLKELNAIFAHHHFWYQKKKISDGFDKLRTKGNLNREQWTSLMGESCQLLSVATGARRVTLCYLGLDSPLIVRSNDSGIRNIQDGQVPPVFARVIQTKDSLWWITEAEMNAFKPMNSIRRSDVYKSDRAIVLPITVGGDAYGAIALTDFEELDEILSSDDRKHYIESIITNLIDLLSSRWVKRREASTNQNQRMSNEIIRDFTTRSVVSTSKQDIVQALLGSLTENIVCSAMYFDFESATERLHLTHSVNMAEDVLELWKSVSFRARPTNRVSPFAITINERKSVFVEDIRTFFNLLMPQSIDVISASGTKAFVCAPVMFADEVLGLLCVLDEKGSKTVTSEITNILELPLRYLAYQIEQIRMTKVLAKQEQILSRFADPALSKMLMTAEETQELVVGNTEACAIVVQDLRGSTQSSRLEPDPRKLAMKLAQIYQTAALIARKYGGSFDKGNGDGTITTIGTSDFDNGGALNMALLFLEHVEFEAKRLLGVRSSIVVVHRGRPFRGIMGNTWRIAWDTCGRDINDTFSIEKAAKNVDGVILAVSNKVISLESESLRKILNELASSTIEVDGLDGSVLLFDSDAVKKINQFMHPARQVA